jgi:hypothetical protein
MTVEELEPRFVESQRQALEVLRKMSTAKMILGGQQ